VPSNRSTPFPSLQMEAYPISAHEDSLGQAASPDRCHVTSSEWPANDPRTRTGRQHGVCRGRLEGVRDTDPLLPKTPSGGRCSLGQRVVSAGKGECSHRRSRSFPRPTRVHSTSQPVSRLPQILNWSGSSGSMALESDPRIGDHAHSPDKSWVPQPAGSPRGGPCRARSSYTSCLVRVAAAAEAPGHPVLA